MPQGVGYSLFTTHQKARKETSMSDKPKSYDMITDFITGKDVPNIGAQENRQKIERFLVETKGYSKGDIEVDAEIAFTIGNEVVRSSVDLVARVEGKRFMVVKCVPGSLGSRHRETLSAARLLDDYQIPFSLVTDGKNAELLDTVTGELLDQGMDAIPSKDEARKRLNGMELKPYPENKLERERIIFRTYDDMNVNVSRKLKDS
jgi:hypothetical protein